MDCVVNGCEGSHVQPVSILPVDNTLRHAAKLSLESGKPIRMDYFIPSLKGEVFIATHIDQKLLIKSGHRAPILKVYKTGREYIIIGVHDIYIVADSIRKRAVKFETGS
jgi:hypothetical protein